MSIPNNKMRFGHDDTDEVHDAVSNDHPPANGGDNETGAIERPHRLEEGNVDHHQSTYNESNNVKKTIQREDTMKTSNVHPFVDKSSSLSNKYVQRSSPSMHAHTEAADENGSVVIVFHNNLVTHENDDVPTSTSTTVDDQYYPRTDSINTFKTSNNNKDNVTEFDTYDDDIVQYENDILGKLLTDTGRWSFGIKVIELWILDEGETYLYRPSSGYWLDPVYGHGDTLETENQRDCLRRLFDESYSNYIPPTPVVPGESLVGNLWALSSSIGPTHSRGNSSVGSHNSGTRSWLAGGGAAGGGSANSAFRSQTGTPNNATSSSTVLLDAVRNLTHFQGNQHQPHPLHQPSSSAYRRRKIVWRDVASIANDPDQPWNYRLQALSNIGLGWAAGIPFHTRGGGKGIVVFMARDTVDMHRLTSLENEDYLLGATESIGATYSCFIPRRKAITLRKQEMDYTWNRVRRKFVHQSTNSTITNGTTSHHPPQNADKSHKWDFDIDNTSLQLSDHKSQSPPCGRISDVIEWLKKKLLTSSHKVRGGNMQIPPVFSWNQTFVSFVGVLFTIYAVVIFNTYLIIPKLGPAYCIPLGPYGALVTLQFGLTSAPAAQPRNVFFGQLVSILIAIAISYLDFLPNPYKQAFAVATAVAVMVRSSITHPPAGASALIYSTGEVRWGSFFFFMVGNMIAIVMAIFINNLSSKRHYPTYWGSIPYVDELFGRMMVKKFEKDTFVRHQTQRLSI